MKRIGSAGSCQYGFVQAKLPQTGVGDHLKAGRAGHAVVERHRLGLDRLVHACLAKPIAALRFGQYAQPQWHDRIDFAGGSKQRSGIASLQFELDLANRLLATARRNPAAVEDDLDAAAMTLHAGRSPRDIDPKGGLERARGEQRIERPPRFVEHRLRIGNVAFPFRTGKQAGRRRARCLDGLDVALPGLAHAQGQASLPQRLVGRVVIGRFLVLLGRTGEQRRARQPVDVGRIEVKLELDLLSNCRAGGGRFGRATFVQLGGLRIATQRGRHSHPPATAATAGGSASVKKWKTLPVPARRLATHGDFPTARPNAPAASRIAAVQLTSVCHKFSPCPLSYGGRHWRR